MSIGDQMDSRNWVVAAIADWMDVQCWVVVIAVAVASLADIAT